MADARDAADRAMLALLRGHAPLPGPSDPLWDDCARRLTQEALPGVALGLIAAAGRLDDLTPGARGHLERELNKVRAGQVILLNRFENLIDRLQAAGIEFLVHKGGALAPLIYDRPEDRPMVDIDIIIRPEDWARVRDGLDSWGYRMPRGASRAFWLENYYNIAVASPEDPPASFDVHWGITQEGRYHVRTSDLFERAVPYTWCGRGLRRMGNEDLLLSLFLHLAYHYFEARLLWLYDMKRVMERIPIDWDVVAAHARHGGLETVTALNLSFVDKVFPGVVPPEAVRLTRCGALRKGLLGPLRSTHPLHLFRGDRHRPVHFALGLLTIDSPWTAVRFAGDKIARSLRWAGRSPRTR